MNDKFGRTVNSHSSVELTCIYRRRRVVATAPRAMQVKGPERLLSETNVLISDTTWRHVLAINSSVEIREKALKAAGYAAKLASYILTQTGASTATRAKLLKGLAKACSDARRLFCLVRWVKYFDDFAAAAKEVTPLRELLLAEASLSCVVDAMQDVVTFDRLGLLGWVPAWFERVADELDVVLAVSSTAAAWLKVRALESKSVGGGATPKARQQKLQLLKYACDVCKTADAAGIERYGPGKPLAFVGAILSSYLSARKQALKLAPKEKA